MKSVSFTITDDLTSNTEKEKLYYELKDRLDQPRAITAVILNATSPKSLMTEFRRLHNSFYEKDIFIKHSDSISDYGEEYTLPRLIEKYSSDEEVDIIAIAFESDCKLIISDKYRNTPGAYEYFAIKTGIINLYN